MLFRKNVDDGVWCGLLLPLVLMRAHGAHEYVRNDFDVVRRESCLLSALLAALGLILASKISRFDLYFWLERPESVKARVLLKEQKHGDQQVLWHKKIREIDQLTRWALLIGFILAFCNYERAAVAGLLVSLYPRLLTMLVTKLPRTFSVGEVLLVSQAASIFVYETITLILQPGFENSYSREASLAIHGRVLLFFCCVVCFINLVLDKWLTSSVWLLSTGVFVLFGVALPYIQKRLHHEPLGWLVHQLLLSNEIVVVKGLSIASSTLVLFWLSLILIALSLIGGRGEDELEQPDVTRRRKLFHGLVVLVFTSGLLFDRHLLRLTSQLLLCLMLVMEALRLHSVQPLAHWLTSALDHILDTRDRDARLVLTHIYLLVGCSLPLWIDISPQDDLVLWSGVLSVGIGDAVASVVGSKVGRLKWTDSEKSVEGTVASIFVQAVVVFALDALSIVQVHNHMKVGAAIVVTAITEALTTQVDNLVLPLTMMFFLY